MGGVLSIGIQARATDRDANDGDDDMEVDMADDVITPHWAQQTFGSAQLGDARLSKDWS